MNECVLFRKNCCDSLSRNAVHLTEEGFEPGLMSPNIDIERVDEIDLYETCEKGLKVKEGIRVEYNCLECGAERHAAVTEKSKPVKKFLKQNGVVLQ